MPYTVKSDMVFLDAGLFIGAIMLGDPRESEAYPIVESARKGEIRACTTVGVLSEVYAALTWVQAIKRHSPQEAQKVITRVIEEPSAILILADGLEASLLHLELAAKHSLTARRIHDARHAATALQNGITHVYTYDPLDWRDFVSDGIVLAGPPSTMARLATNP